MNCMPSCLGATGLRPVPCSAAARTYIAERLRAFSLRLEPVSNTASKVSRQPPRRKRGSKEKHVGLHVSYVRTDQPSLLSSLRVFAASRDISPASNSREHGFRGLTPPARDEARRIVACQKRRFLSARSTLSNLRCSNRWYICGLRPPRCWVCLQRRSACLAVVGCRSCAAYWKFMADSPRGF